MGFGAVRVDHTGEGPRPAKHPGLIDKGRIELSFESRLFVVRFVGAEQTCRFAPTESGQLMIVITW